MNDNTKVLDQNPISGLVASNVVVPQVGSSNKEQAPHAVVESKLSEFIKPEVEKPNVDQEQKDMGVVVKSDKPDLTFEHEELGVVHSGPNVTVLPAPTGLVQISEKRNINNSSTWYDWLLKRVDKVMKLKLLGA